MRRLDGSITRHRRGAADGQAGNDRQEPEVGYRILPQYWGQGIATEVLKQCVQTIRQNKQLPFLVAYVFTENTSSIRVLEKAEFQFISECFNEEFQCLDRKYQHTFTE